MIRKWIYKLRYILIILSALLGLLGLSWTFGYWSDPTITRQIWTYWNNPYQQSFDIAVLNPWIPLTQTLWITKNMFYFNKNNYWWWWENGLPYVFIANDDYSAWCEGYIEKYQSCSSISWDSINNCTNIPVWQWTAEIFRAFFSNVSNDDYYQFWAWWWDFWWVWFFRVSSEKLWQSIGWEWVYWIWGCGSAWLTWSLNYWSMSFDLFQNSMGDNSPWWLPSGGGGWTNINVWEDLTNWQVSNALSSYWFSKNICYWGLSASSDYSSSIPWTWKTIFQIYNEFNPNSISNIVDWYSYYKNWYNDYPYFSFSWWTYITDSHSPFLVNWNFYLSAFRLFQYWEYYGVGFYPASDIVEYCDLLLNKNPDSLYTWDDWSSIVDNSSVIDYWSAIYRALSWDIQLLYSWDISKLSWENLNFDSQSFFSNLTAKFARLNNSDENLFQVVWIIPSYILVFMFALILIRMISK